MARSFTSTTENDVLNSLFGTPSYTAHPSNLVLRLSTTLSSDAGVITEPSGGSYAEQAITFGAAASGVVANTNTITFPVATAPWGKIIAWAVRDTVAGVTLASGYMGSLYGYVLGLTDSTDPTFPDGVLPAISPPANGTRLFFVKSDPDGVAVGDPASFGVSALEEGVEYFAKGSDPSFFSISLTNGGATVPITAGSTATYAPRAGDFQIWTSKTKTVNTGDQLVFGAGSITISLK